MNKSILFNYFFILSLLSSIFLPFINVGSLGLYGTTIISFVFLPFIFISRIKVNKYFFIILLIVCCVIISTLYSSAIGFSSETYRNYIEALKYAQFLPYLILARYVDSYNYEKVFNRTIFIISYFYIFIFFVQYFNILSLRNFFVNIYLGPSSVHAESVINGWRLTITGAGPNEGAAIGVFLLIYHLVHTTFRYNRNSLIISLILVVIILTTQSRTALIGMLATTTLIFMFNKVLNLFQKISIFIFFSIIFIYIYLQLDLEYVKKGFEALSENENNSVNVRLDNVGTALDLFKDSPFFGVGPAKNEISTIIDSEYLLIIQRYGLLGILVFSFFILNMIFDGLKNRNLEIGMILLSYTFFTLFVMLTNSAYSGYQLMSISVFLIISMSIFKRY